MSKLVQKILPGSGKSDAASASAENSGAVCIRREQSGLHTGVAIKTNASDTLLLPAQGTLPDLKIGASYLPTSGDGFSGADSSGAISGLTVAGSDVVAVEGQWADERILAFAGSSTPKKALETQSAFDYQGQAYLEYRPANQSTIELEATAQLSIDPDTRWVRLSIINQSRQDVPFEKLEWSQIGYCDGQFQSTGSGRYQLLSNSGRVTNLIGLSADGPAGTAMLSGALYGEKEPTLAVLGFALTGVTGTLLGVVTMPEDQQ